ncbi:MAG: hypothetical protein GY832_14370 [Chloroflexi bacterium]|nr:hypothetical protein [Chloroflexota bacterium]
MEIRTFERIVASFADAPQDVDYSQGVLIAQIRDEIFEVSFQTREGVLYCVEGENNPILAGQWIVQRLGRFNTLARRILDYFKKDDLLIPVTGTMVDVLDSSPNAEPNRTADVGASLGKFVSDLPAGMTNVIYLTSDAGEGKTSLIQAMARSQAEKYLARETDWLLLPVALGGQPFIRLDDLIIGGLANRLRFPFYYYDSVIELVKLNCLVLALDGFEELLVATKAGDAVSSLGSLVSKLDSKGRLLIAARKAYYDYKDFKAQARLRQSLGSNDVAFAEISLRRWSRDQFFQLCSVTGITNDSEAKNLYSTIETKLGEFHPLLTRAVLARRLISEYHKTNDRIGLVNRLSQTTGEEYFDEFVSTLLEREVNEKWIGVETPARPLLTVEDHHTLLMAIAEEMWRVGTDALGSDILELMTELVVADQLRRPANIVRQAKERIKQHALLHRVEGTSLYQFDHEDFKNFYLGRRLALLLTGERDLNEIRTVLEIGSLSDMTVRVAAAKVPSDIALHCDVIRDLCVIAEVGTRTSYVRENTGQLAIKLSSICESESAINLHHLYFGADMLENIQLSRIDFKDCIFERTSLQGADLKLVTFQQCEVLHFELRSGETYDVQMDRESLPHSISVFEDGDESEQQYFDPNQKRQILEQHGITIIDSVELPEVQKSDLFIESNEVRMAGRAVRLFQRATTISESVLRVRFGKTSSYFLDSVLPQLLEYGVLEQVPRRGGNQDHFRLAVGFDEIEQARIRGRGDFQRFLDAASSMKSEDRH